MVILSVILIYFTLHVLKLFIQSIQEISSLRMAIVKNNTNNKCWQGSGEKGILIYCWWESKRYSHCRSFLKKLKSELPLDSVIPEIINVLLIHDLKILRETKG